MVEYIERERVEEMLENAQMITDGEHCGYCTEDVCLENLPTADVAEVVRCKDCNIYNGHRYCTYFECTVFDDDFCSYGERKEGAEE